MSTPVRRALLVTVLASLWIVFVGGSLTMWSGWPFLHKLFAVVFLLFGSAIALRELWTRE